jgi:hypothetical protein
MSLTRVKLRQWSSRLYPPSVAWRHRQLLFDWRPDRHARQGNLPRIQVWNDRADSKCGARIRLQRNLHPRGVSGTIEAPMIADMLAKEPDAIKDILSDQAIGQVGRPEANSGILLGFSCATITPDSAKQIMFFNFDSKHRRKQPRSPLLDEYDILSSRSRSFRQQTFVAGRGAMQTMEQPQK